MRKKKDTIRSSVQRVVKPFPIKWFEAQFGKRPNGNIRKLQKEYRLAVSIMMHAEQMLQDIDTWEKRRDAAIKAWIAHEKA